MIGQISEINNAVRQIFVLYNVEDKNVTYNFVRKIVVTNNVLTQNLLHTML